MLNIILFVLSNFGYVSFLIRYLKQTRYLAWVETFSIQMVVLLVGAVFGYLEPTMQGLYYLGLVLLVIVFSLNISKLKDLSININLVDIVFAAWFIVYSYLLLKSNLVHYDNFSHWALIVKFLSVEGRLPSAGDTIIGFTTYPPGSALFSNYVLRFIGYGEGKMLFSQFMLIASCFYAMFNNVRSKKLQALVVNFGLWGLWYLLPGGIGVDTMLVDLILPLMGLAAISIIKHNIESPLIMWPMLLVNIAALVSVKNSGIYFALVPVLYLLILTNGFFKKVFSLLLSLVGFSTFYIWKVHVKSLDLAGPTKHSMSVDNYLSVFGEKDKATLLEITKAFIKKTFDLTSPLTYVLIAFVIILIYSLYKFEKKSVERRTLLLAAWSLTFYYVMVLVMYFVSMPTAEAVVLAAYERYVVSGLVLASGILASLYIDVSERSEVDVFSVLILALCLGLSVVGISKEVNYLKEDKISYNVDLKQTFKKASSENFELNDKSYFIAHSQDQGIVNNYLSFYGKYYFFTPNVKARASFGQSKENFIKLIEENDYIYIFDEKTPMLERFEKDFNIRLDVGIYETDELLEKMR